MHHRTNRIICAFFCLLTLSVSVLSQSGGGFSINSSVIAGGGGSNSSGGGFLVSGTVGQPMAGTVSAGGQFSVRGGFWSVDALGPTAASVTISGRVQTARGNGIRNVQLTIVGGNGVNRTVITGPFGAFHFDEIEVGQTYIITAFAKHYRFGQPSQIITVMDNIEDLEFTALKQQF